jgi:hypothetical protein
LLGWKKLYLFKGGKVDTLEEYTLKCTNVLPVIVYHSFLCVK